MHRGQLVALTWIITGALIATTCVVGFVNGKYDHNILAFKDWLMAATWTILSATGYLLSTSTRTWKASHRNRLCFGFLCMLWCLHVIGASYTFFVHTELDIGISESMQGTRLLMSLLAGLAAITFWAIDHKSA